MDKEFKTTFIPKKKLTQNRGDEKGIVHRRSSSLLGLLAGLLFVTALISIAGVYLYKMSIQEKLKQQEQSIRLAEKSFEPGLILELKKLDIRLRAASELLNKHIALSDFFESFGESILPNVSFDSFSFSLSEGVPKVHMTGKASGYLPIAQQSDLFEQNEYIQNHIFSNFQLTDEREVTFDLDFSLNPDLILYGRKIKNNKLEDVNVDDNIIIQNENKVLPQGTDVNFNSRNNQQTNI